MHLPFAAVTNPVDFTASGGNRTYIDSLETVLTDEGVDIVICVTMFSLPGVDDELIPQLAEIITKATKPVLVFTEYGPYTEKYLLEFYRQGVAGFSSISRTVRAARFLAERGSVLRRISGCRENSLSENFAGNRGAGCLGTGESDSIDLSAAYEQWKAGLRTSGKAG